LPQGAGVKVPLKHSGNFQQLPHQKPPQRASVAQSGHNARLVSMDQDRPAHKGGTITLEAKSSIMADLSGEGQLSTLARLLVENAAMASAVCTDAYARCLKQTNLERERMARGFKTGGRQKGTPNKRTQEMLEEIISTGETPLEYMIRVMRDPEADVHRRDKMAQMAAPFPHPRLTAVEDASREPPIVALRWLTEEEWLERQSSADGHASP
jgi:hypothetical protein